MEVFGHITFLTGEALSSWMDAAFVDDVFMIGIVSRTEFDDVDDAFVVVARFGNARACDPVTSARPRICSSWAVFRKSLSCSCPMCTSPLYMKRNRLSTSSDRTSRNITIGCSHGLAFNSFRKYGLQALKTTLCAVNDRISQAKVTSTKSSSSRKCRNDDRIELWKSFHFSEYCCSDGDGDKGGSIFALVVLLFSVVCNNVDSVISYGCDAFFRLFEEPKKKKRAPKDNKFWTFPSIFSLFYFIWRALFAFIGWFLVFCFVAITRSIAFPFQ